MVLTTISGADLVAACRFAGTYDPYDVLAYGIGVGACYIGEKIAIVRRAGARTSQA